MPWYGWGGYEDHRHAIELCSRLSMSAVSRKGKEQRLVATRVLRRSSACQTLATSIYAHGEQDRERLVDWQMTP